MSQRKYRLDICDVCKAKEGVSSKKRVYQCSYCDRWFCKKHLKPRLSLFVPTQVTVKDSAWKNFVEREWKRKDGHPDYVYTKEKLEEFKVEEKAPRAKMDAFLDRSNSYGVTEERPKRKRKIPIRKIAILLTLIVILIPIIYIAFQNFTQLSSYTKVTIVEGQVAKVDFDNNTYRFVYALGQFVVATPLIEYRYYDAVEGAVYHDLGLEIVVSEVHSDYIVLLVKPRY